MNNKPVSLEKILSATWPCEAKLLLLELVRRGGNRRYTPSEVAQELQIHPGVTGECLQLLRRLDYVVLEGGQVGLIQAHEVRDCMHGAETRRLRRELEEAHAALQARPAFESPLEPEPKPKKAKKGEE